MTDYRPRYKPFYIRRARAYEVIEEHSGVVFDIGPMTYDEAQDIADRKNAELAALRVGLPVEQARSRRRSAKVIPPPRMC
jgi:hypothetical protein